MNPKGAEFADHKTYSSRQCVGSLAFFLREMQKGAGKVTNSSNAIQ